jgi:hypothetical protein
MVFVRASAILRSTLSQFFKAADAGVRTTLLALAPTRPTAQHRVLDILQTFVGTLQKGFTAT